MATTLNNIKIQLRTDDLSNWTNSNPVLKNGEIAIVVDENNNENIKIGNGISTFNDLNYLNQTEFKSNKIYTTELRAKSVSQGYKVSSTPTSMATGILTEAESNFGVVHGIEAKVNLGDDYAFVFNGTNLQGIEQRYTSHGEGTFNVNPLNGISGFYIGETSLDRILSSCLSSIDMKDYYKKSETSSNVQIEEKTNAICAYADTKSTVLIGEHGKDLSSTKELSIVNILPDDYYKMVSEETLNPEVLYVVSSDQLNAFDMTITDVAEPVLSNDAATKNYVDEVSSKIPTKTSQLTNDSGFLTSHQSLADYYVKSETSSSNQISSKFKDERSYFVITEDIVTVTTDDTKGVSPYNTGYGYTNITIDQNAGIEWKDGASYVFIVNSSLVVASNYRNARIRIGNSGDWKPVMNQGSILAANSYLTKGVQTVFYYKTTYQSNGAIHMQYDANTTYSYIQNLIGAKSVKIDSSGYGARYSYMFATTPLSAIDERYSSFVNSSGTGSSKTVVSPSSGKFYIDRKPLYVYSANIGAGSTNNDNLYVDYYASDLRYTSNINSTWVPVNNKVYVWLNNFNKEDYSFTFDASLGSILGGSKLSTKFPSSYGSDVYLYLLGWNTSTYSTLCPIYDQECRIYKYIPSTGQMITLEQDTIKNFSEYYNKTEIDEKIGQIGTLLDQLNGEVI